MPNVKDTETQTEEQKSDVCVDATENQRHSRKD